MKIWGAILVLLVFVFVPLSGPIMASQNPQGVALIGGADKAVTINSLYALIAQLKVLLERLQESMATTKKGVDIKTKDSLSAHAVGYTQHIDVDTSPYSIDQKYLTGPLYAMEATTIDPESTLLRVSTNPAGYNFFFLVDEKTKAVRRAIKKGYPMDADTWFTTASGRGIRIVVSSFNDDLDQVVLFDYAHDYSKILYAEKDPEVQLVELCEVRCTGKILFTDKGDLLISRYQKQTGTTQVKRLGTIRITLPSEYKLATLP